MTTTALLLVGAIAAAAALPGDEAVQRRLLLLVAANEGDAQEQKLRWAESDAEQFGEVMVNVAGVRPEDVFSAVGADARRVETQLGRVSERLDRYAQQDLRVELFVYVASHADPTSLHLYGRHLPMNAFRKWFEAANVQARVMFVDTCYSGSVWRQRSVSSAIRSVTRRPAAAGTVYISASAANEIAQESDDLGGSYFTSHLMSGLRGAADGDGDGRVTMAEIYRHTYNRTLQDSFSNAPVAQHPQFKSDLRGESDLVISELGRSETHLIVPSTFRGHLLVVDDRSERVVVDVFHVHLDQEKRYALRAGRYRVVVREGKGVFAGELSAHEGEAAPLPPLHQVKQQALIMARGPRHYDPKPPAIFLRIEPFWRWTDRTETAAGMMGIAVGAEFRVGEHGFVTVSADYARTLRGNDQWLRSLGLLRLALQGGYVYDASQGSVLVGGAAGVGWGRQEVIASPGVSSTVSDSEFFTGAAVLRGVMKVSRLWHVALSAEGGALLYRQEADTRAAPYLQLAAGIDFPL